MPRLSATLVATSLLVLPFLQGGAEARRVRIKGGSSLSASATMQTHAASEDVAACASSGKCATGCWMHLECPAGQEHYGDGSACRGGSQPNCDLGFCSSSPNLNMNRCPLKVAAAEGELEFEAGRNEGRDLWHMTPPRRHASARVPFPCTSPERVVASRERDSATAHRIRPHRV